MGNQQTSFNINPQTKIKACCDQVSLFITNPDIKSSDITCSICLQIYTRPRIMKCNHNFCEPCIKDWGKRKTATCPYCRCQIKSNKGNFGKVDKIIQKKINQTLLKCRNCSWTGSKCQFLECFGVEASLDDDPIVFKDDEKPCFQQIKLKSKIEEQIQNIKNQALTQQKEKPMTMIDCFDGIRQQIEKKYNPADEDIFFVQTPVYRYSDIELEMFTSHQRWDDVFWNEDNMQSIQK